MNDNLAAHLRKWGLKVVEVNGWQSRGARGTFTPRAVLVHHTAAVNTTKDAPSLGIVTNGRPGIPGPLSQFVLGRSGTVYLVAGGRANHAGVGGPIGGIPKDAGNRYAWGIEAENNGVGEKWSATQLQAYYRLCAALAAYSKFGATGVIAHKEWATPKGRKSDPAGINMTDFREKVKAAIAAGPNAVSGSLRTGDPVIGEGDTGQYVTNIQNALVKHGFLKVTQVDGDFGPTTKAAVVAFQKAKGLVADGVVGQKTWDALRLPKAGTTPTPAPAPAVTGGERMLVQFKGDPHVWEVVGSKLYHVTASAWKARGLTSAQVKVLEPTHALNSLVKVSD